MADDTGVLKNIYPPGNNGTKAGKGKIVYENASYEFITPTANNDRPLTVNKPLTFTIVDGVVTNVVQEG
tara:strand:- start:1781 stop:1987 length:207 start_codon:yes stop_codon:yes gene_type:complete